MSYPCRMTDPFLPIYDFDALAAEPEYTPPPAPKSMLEQLLERRITFDPNNYACIVITPLHCTVSKDPE